ncbi:MAG: RDD family protein, partial [Candidatus Poribacteria bacterium]
EILRCAQNDVFELRNGINKIGVGAEYMESFTPDEKEQLKEMLDSYEVEKEPKGPEYAGFWRRYFASIIDGLLISVAEAIIGFFLANTIPKLVRGSLWGFIPMPSGYVSFLMGWMYFALMESSPHQATIGKIVMGINVVDLNGNRVSFFRASNRFFAKTLSVLLLFIGYIMAGFTEKKQALHDIIARCLVMKR